MGSVSGLSWSLKVTQFEQMLNSRDMGLGLRRRPGLYLFLKKYLFDTCITWTHGTQVDIISISPLKMCTFMFSYFNARMYIGAFSTFGKTHEQVSLSYFLPLPPIFQNFHIKPVFYFTAHVFLKFFPVREGNGPEKLGKDLGLTLFFLLEQGP